MWKLVLLVLHLPALSLSLSQVPFLSPMPRTDFRFKDGPGVFTPMDLIQLPRPGEGIANPLGDLVLVPVSKYSFHDKTNYKSIYIASVESPTQPLEILLPAGGQAFWLDARTLAHIVLNEQTKVLDFYTISIQFGSELTSSEPPNFVASFPTSSSSNFRYIPRSGYLVFSDFVHDDGDLKNAKDNDDAWNNRGNSAFVYDDTYVRHWDTWRGPKHSSLFSVPLSQNREGNWVLGDDYINVLKGTEHRTPVEPFGGTDDFDVTSTHIVYTTLDPGLPAAWHTRQNVYIVDITASSGPKELTSGEQGATHSPVFSTSGNKVAWLELDADGYEADRAKIVIYDLDKDVRFTLTQDWDRSPVSLAFSLDDQHIYFTAGDEAKTKIFVLPVPETPPQSTTHPNFSSPLVPLALTHSHSSSTIQPLAGGRLLFSQNSLVKPNDVYVLRGLDKLDEISVSIDFWNKHAKSFVHASIDQLTAFTDTELQSKSLNQGEEFWFEGAEGKKIQGWIAKPKGWTPQDKDSGKKKWPVLLCIHGGPQGAWEDGWSTRWNLNLFAQQGYFTIAINPTGSTTFGQALTDAITEDWGGKPFVDLQKGWKYVLDNFPEIDADRAVAAGASYGGYAINWIQSNPEFGFRFKALVCHDGVFDTNYNGYATDELFFFNHEFGGPAYEHRSRSLSERFSPSNYVHKWSTPQLVIHSSKDHRIPETDGIAAFHALQQRSIPSRLVIFPDENHWVLNHGNSLKWNYEIFKWFDQFIGKDE